MPARFQPDRMPGYVLPKYEYRKPPELGGGDSPLYPVIVVGAGLAGLTSALELARCTGIDGNFAEEAIERVTSYFAPGQMQEARSQQPAAVRLFDRLSAQLDAMPNARRATALAPVISRIEEQRGDLTGIDGV